MLPVHWLWSNEQYTRIHCVSIYLQTFFLVKCMRFFISTENLNFRRFNNGFRRLPKIFNDFWKLPKISPQLAKVTEGVERFSTTSKQGQWFPKDFQPISSIIEEFQRCSDNFSNGKKKNYFIVLKELHSLLSVRREKLVWMVRSQF